MLFGAFQLLRRRKGGKLHKVIGYIWVVAMYLVCFTSFGIQTLNGGFSWLHGLSVLTIITVSIGLWSAIKRKIHAHRSFMTGSYFGILGAFVGVIVVPSRRIPSMAVDNPLGLALWIAILVLTAAFTVIGFRNLFKIERKLTR
jgi:uncharacterized membrane protein